MDQLTNISVLVLDFDGVITERGEALKEEAWEKLALRFEPEEQKVKEQFLAELRNQRSLIGQGKAKGSRFDILKNTFLTLGYSQSVAETKTSRYAEIYNQEVQWLITNEPLSPGAKEAIKSLSKRLPIFVNTATPTDAAIESLGNLELADSIKKVLGFPPGKLENLQCVAKETTFGPSQILFVGDGEGDVKAAQEFGCHFIGRVNAWNKWENKPFPLIHSLTELTSILS